MTVRRLGPDDAESYARLRHEMLLDSPRAFLSSPGDPGAGSLETTRRQLGAGPQSVVFGAFAPDLVGAVGVMHDTHRKAAHKAHVWGMYVAPAHRSRGLGRALLDAAVAHARTLPGVEQVRLGVSAPGARRLYESAGFEVWGSEPDALRHEGESIVEHHMVLYLPTGTR